MLFANGLFLIFLPIFIIIYYMIPYRFQKYVLLVGSLFFAYCQSMGTLIAVMFIGAISFTFSCIFGTNEKVNKAITFFTIMLLTVCMIIARMMNLALIGISFYTLRVIGYVIDVWNGQESEKKLFNHILFVAYFPLLPAGPIEKSSCLFSEFVFPKSFDEKRAYKGFMYLQIGYFMKFVIADRSAVIVDWVYNDYSVVAGSICLVAVIMYSIQIYTDFAGYSYIALGISEILGINICRNFKRPYLSESIKEFWQRWHISLSSWLKEYVYIPLGGNRKGFIRKEINIFITFLVSGLWHGQGMHFIAWGAIHGGYRILGDTKNLIMKPIKSSNTARRMIKTVITFLLVSFAWIFFRASDMREALRIIIHILTDFRAESIINGDIFRLGWGRLQVCGIIMAYLVLVFIEILVEKGRMSFENFCSLSRIKRNIICYSILIWIIICIVQIYGMGQDTGFIYAKF